MFRSGGFRDEFQVDGLIWGFLDPHLFWDFVEADLFEEDDSSFRVVWGLVGRVWKDMAGRFWFSFLLRKKSKLFSSGYTINLVLLKTNDHFKSID